MAPVDLLDGHPQRFEVVHDRPDVGGEGVSPAAARHRQLDGARDALVQAGVQEVELVLGGGDEGVHARRGGELGLERGDPTGLHVVVARLGQGVLRLLELPAGLAVVDARAGVGQHLALLGHPPALLDGRFHLGGDHVQGVPQGAGPERLDRVVEPGAGLHGVAHGVAPRLADRERVDACAGALAGDGEGDADAVGQQAADRGGGDRHRRDPDGQDAGRGPRTEGEDATGRRDGTSDGRREEPVPEAERRHVRSWTPRR